MEGVDACTTRARDEILLTHLFRRCSCWRWSRRWPAIGAEAFALVGAAGWSASWGPARARTRGWAEPLGAAATVQVAAAAAAATKCG